MFEKLSVESQLCGGGEDGKLKYNFVIGQKYVPIIYYFQGKILVEEIQEVH